MIGVKCALKCVDKGADDQFQYLGTTERAQQRSDDYPLLNGRAEVGSNLEYLVTPKTFAPGNPTGQLPRQRRI